LGRLFPRLVHRSISLPHVCTKDHVGIVPSSRVSNPNPATWLESNAAPLLWYDRMAKYDDCLVQGIQARNKTTRGIKIAIPTPKLTSYDRFRTTLHQRKRLCVGSSDAVSRSYHHLDWTRYSLGCFSLQPAPISVVKIRSSFLDTSCQSCLVHAHHFSTSQRRFTAAAEALDISSQGYCCKGQSRCVIQFHGIGHEVIHVADT
jgi:hypothetical protein